MDVDPDKVDEMTLALLYLVSSTDKSGTRAWKGFDSDALGRLHEKGYIGDPHGKGLSILMTEEGVRLSKDLVERHFAKK
jgi:hypothetical protein